MSDIKTQMIEAVERGLTTPGEAHDYVSESWAAGADMLYTRMKEAGYRNPLVADMFCQTCHYTGPHEVSERCSTGFVPGDPEQARALNARLRFGSF